MNFIFICAFLLGMFQADGDSSLLQQSKQQAEYYIEEISRGNERDANLWALGALYKSHPKVQAFIEKKITSNNYSGAFYRPFISREVDHSQLLRRLTFSSGSQALLIDLLLKETNKDSQLKLKKEFTQQYKLTTKHGVDYKKLVDRILEGSQVDSTIVPHNDFHLVHFYFLNSPQGFNLLSDSYKASLQKHWEEQSKNIETNSVKNSLLQFTLFRLRYFTDKFNETQKLFTFITNDELIPNTIFKYKVFRQLDYTMYSTGYYDLALQATRDHAVPLAAYLGDKRARFGALSAQAIYLSNLGKVKEAIDLNLKILKEAEDHSINVPQSVLQTNLGVDYRKSGEFNKYLDLLLQALETSKNEQNYQEHLTILMNLYLHYQENSDKKSALLYLNEAKELVEREGNSEQLARVNMNFGIFYRDFDQDYTRAEEYLSKAKSTIDLTNAYLDYIEILQEEIEVYEMQHKYKEALKRYDQIIDLSKSRNKRKFLEASIDKINIYLKTDSLAKAGNLLDKLKSYDLSYVDFEDVVKYRTVEAEYLIKTGNPEKAYEILEPTLDQVIDWAQSSTSIQSGFWNIEPEFIDFFQLTADLLIESGRKEEAVEVLDKIKTINDASLYQNPMVKSSLLNENELTDYKRLTAQLDALRKQQLLVSDNEQLSLQTRIDQLSAKKRMLDRKISALANKEPVALNQVQRKLGGREMVLHITELNNWYYVARVSRSDVTINKIRLDSTLRAQFTGAIENMSVGKTDMNELSQISQVLDLGSLPSWVNTLTIIPDSYLYQLPIDVLPLTADEHSYSYGDATYMVEKFKTHYLTSLNDFRIPDKPNKKYNWDFVGYGISEFPSYANQKNLVPLPYAESEVSNIIENLTNVDTKTAYLNSSSSKRTFKETASQARILHLATHSELSERDPLFSKIYMSPEKPTSEEELSGQIFAYELFELNLSNDLIMLNSCESGSGTYLQGSGVMGISRALRYAGANSLILNLWSVNDMMASDFAVEFYKNINEGQSKDEALRQTKLHFLKTKNANPHYWGPYMLIGNRDPLVRPYREANIYVAASFMLLFVAVASFSLLKEWRKNAA